MAYDKDNQRLYTYTDAQTGEKVGITTLEIYKCLRYNKRDKNGNRQAALAIKYGNINKWAKFKPIRYPQTERLTNEQRKGTIEDNNNGIFYGLKVTGGIMDGMITEDMAELHNAKFEYLRPEGGTQSPFRTLDFASVGFNWGYRHNAQPTLQGGFPLENGVVKAFINDGDGVNSKIAYGLSGIDVHFNAAFSNEGVDIMEMMNVQGVDLADTKAKSFPCILVTDAKGKSYFTALTARYDDEYRAEPIQVIESNAPQGWYVLMRKPIYSTDVVLNKSYPFTEVQEGVKATLFLYKSQSATEPIVATGVNFHDYWIPLDNNLAGTSARKIVIPDAIGMNMVFTTYKSVHFVVSNVTLLAVNSHPVFNIQLAENSGETTTNKVSVTVTVTLSDGSTSSYTWTSNLGYNPNNTLLQPPIARVEFSDILHTSGKKYSGTITVSTSENDASPTIASMTFRDMVVQ